MRQSALETIPTYVISVDGAWDHSRNGIECQDAFINQQTNKVVYVQQVSKGHGNVLGNFKEASGNMESEAIKRAMPQLKKIKFSGYAHDNNNRTRNIFSDNWKELEEHLDSNHTQKSLERKFDKYDKNYIL